MKRLRLDALIVALAWLVAAAPARAERPAPTARVARPAPVETSAAVPRSVFDTWLDRGPQYLLSQVVPTPVTRERHFVGFRVSRWFPAHPDVTEGAVRVGDVVQRVNGRSVEHPDQFLFVWKQLRGVTAVVIEGLRDGLPLKATLAIVDPPALPVPSEVLPVARPADAAPAEPAPGTP